MKKMTDEELKKLAAKAIEDFLFWNNVGDKRRIESSEKIMVLVFDEVKKRKL